MIYEYWLAALPGLSDTKKYRLRERYHDAETVYNIEETEFKSCAFLTEQDREALSKARQALPERDFAAMQEEGVSFLPYFSPAYPEKLRHIPRLPYALYGKGALPDPDRPAVAIVGARRCSPYGEAMALEYGKELAAAGVQIISGMACGIDGAGHRGALEGGGQTFAVLGCGVDVCYPKNHRGLYRDILDHGGLLSELPIRTKPFPFFFPMRNRLISGLSDCVLVIEAREKSGSLITADFALEQGKDVYALPGPANSALSLGCHRLIRQGAGILLGVRDLLEEMRIGSSESVRMADNLPDNNEKELERREFLVYSCLDLFPKGVEQLLQETRLDVSELMDQLVTLQLKGYVKEVSKNDYIRIR